MEDTILHKNELIHPIIQVIGPLLISSVASLFFDKFILNKQIDYQTILVGIIIANLIYSLVKLSNQVRISNDKLIKGIFVDLFGFVRKAESLLLSDIIEVAMIQKNDKYYHIIAKTINSEMLITKEPNKNPAKKRLDEIKNNLKFKPE